jgi:Fe-S cluster assembly protein SufB
MTTAPEALTQEETLATLGRYDFGWADSDTAGATARRGLSADVVADISALKNEPQWMLDFRLKALGLFERKPMPRWGADLSGIDFDNIKYFVRSTEKQAATWDDLPPTSRTPTTSWASRRPRRPAWCPGWPRSTSPRSSTTRSARTWRSRA